MTATYELWYADDLGNRLAYMNDVISFEYAKVIGDIGVAIIQVSNRNSPYRVNLPDRRVHIYRQPVGGSLKLDFTCYLRKFNTETTQAGQFWRSLTAFDSNEILRRRILWNDGNADHVVEVTGVEADNAMKDIWLASFDDGFTDTREITGKGFSAAADETLGPQLTKAFRWRNLLTVLQDLQADSKAQGTEVFFGMVPTGETATEFQTWINQPGRDLSNDIIFSLERGNLSNPKLSYDHTEEVTQVYAGGQGLDTDRVVQTANDSDRYNLSRLNYIEKFRHSQGDTSAVVLSDARDELERHRPRFTFSADISDTPRIRYGRDWNIGDKVGVDYAGIQFSTIIRSVHVKVDPSGQETISSRVENISS